MRAPALLLLLLMFLLAACGDSDQPEQSEGVLYKAFNQRIDSADLELNAQLELKGGPTGGEPVRIEASGPLRTRPNGLPEMDLSLSIGTDGSGQVVETGFLSTGDRAFVKFQDVYYEQPPAEVRKANESLRRGDGGLPASLAALGLSPQRWLARATEEGEETVGGVKTQHVSGTLDVSVLLDDLNRLVRRSGTAIGGATGQEPPDPLTPADMAQVERVVKDPTFDLYVGADDDILRRLSVRVEMAVPEADREAVGGIEGGTLTLTLELHDVNGDQVIEAPERARPLRELTRLLGGVGALGDLAEGLTGGALPDPTDLGDPDTATPEEEPGPESQPPPTTGGGSSDDGTPDAEDFQQYAECLDEVPPGDTDALQSCAELLR